MRELPPFQELLDAHGSAVLGFLSGMMDRHEAEDCAQETMIAALRAYPRFDGEHPRAWLLTIARRKAIDAARSRARRGAEELSGDHGRADGRIDGHADADAVRRAVRELPEGQRLAVVLRFAADLPYRDIALTLECSEPAARQRVRDGLRSLRSGLTEDFDAASTEPARGRQKEAR